jgi:flagellin-like protein
MINMKGISPLIASVLLIAITMTLAAILATFVSSYTRQQLSALPSCVGGTLTFATAAYPKLTGTTTVTAIVEAESVDLTGFTIEVIDSTGNVQSGDGGSSTIKAGSAGTVSNNSFLALEVGNKARIIAKNCPTVKTDWASLK